MNRVTNEAEHVRGEVVLAEGWTFYYDCPNIADITTAQGEVVTLPHTWNGIDGQDGGNDYFRGVCCYKRVLGEQKFAEGSELFLEFGAVNSSARVYLNEREIATHDGGYSAFQVNLTPHLEGENILHIFADNTPNDHVYPQVADFTFYGGIYRDVKLITLGATHFSFGPWGGKGIKAHTLMTEEGDGILNIEATVSGPYDSVHYRLFSSETLVAQSNGLSSTLSVAKVRRWDGLKDPYLYHLVAEVILENKIVDRVSMDIGFREIRFDPEYGCYLNGRSYPLRGVSRHQDREGVGNAITRVMQEEDLALILECGVNSVRLAHYQHDQYFYDLCDRHGLLCWAEIPYITKHMPTAEENTRTQMRELIEQNLHHPSIFCWGISNEISAGGNSDSLYANNKYLYKLCKEMDPTRPVAMAHAFMLPPSDPLVILPDLIGYNLYYGWYMGSMEGNGNFLDRTHQLHPTKPLALTEFGCDSNLQFQTSTPKKGDYSEQYQAEFHAFHCKVLTERSYLWGSFIWNMFDFGADARDEGGFKGRNCKGLVTFDRKTRKDAFYAIKAWYSTEPFVHICGRRYINRAEEVSQVTVYSNQTQVDLWVNDVLLEEQHGSHVFTFTVTLTAETKIEARSGDLYDIITVNQVAEADPRYSLKTDGEIENWFSGLSLEFPEGRLSINNTVGEIISTLGGQAILDEVLAKRSRNRKGIEGQVQMSEQMIKMTMEDVRFAELLRRSKFPADYVFELNQRLNTLKNP